MLGLSKTQLELIIYLCYLSFPQSGFCAPGELVWLHCHFCQFVTEIWSVVFATSLAGVANSRELDDTRTFAEIALTNIWWPLILPGTFLVSFAFAYICSIIYPLSAANCVLPRQPSTLASVMSYIHS